MASDELMKQYREGFLLYCSVLDRLAHDDNYIERLIGNRCLSPFERALRDYIEGWLC